MKYYHSDNQISSRIASELLNKGRLKADWYFQSRKPNTPPPTTTTTSRIPGPRPGTWVEKFMMYGYEVVCLISYSENTDQFSVLLCSIIQMLYVTISDYRSGNTSQLGLLFIRLIIPCQLLLMASSAFMTALLSGLEIPNTIRCSLPLLVHFVG